MLSIASGMLVLACGSGSKSVDMAIAAPTATAQPTAAVNATLPVPSIDTLETMSSAFWLLRGFGPLKHIPESILGSSPQLDDETLIAEWTNFLSGTRIVHAVRFDPDPASFCPNGFMSGHTQPYSRIWTEDVTWSVVPNNDPTDGAEGTRGGNSVKIHIAEDESRLGTRYFGAIEGVLVEAATGIHNGIDLIGDGGLYGRWVPTAATDC